MGCQGRPGAQQIAYVKLNAAKFAHELLVMFNQKPTLTEGGRWPNLAAILYEAAFGGPPPAGLFEYCRAFHKRSKASG